MNKDKIKQLTDAPLQFLDDEYDDCILGLAEDANACYVMYGYQAVKAKFWHKYKDAKTVFAKLAIWRTSIANNQSVLVLVKLSRQVMWGTIKDLKLPTWDQLNDAVIGLTKLPGNHMAVVYNRGDVINKLTAIQQAESDAYVHAVSQFESSIMPIHLGDNTPVYLTIL